MRAHDWRLSESARTDICPANVSPIKLRDSNEVLALRTALMQSNLGDRTRSMIKTVVEQGVWVLAIPRFSSYRPLSFSLHPVFARLFFR